MAQILVIDDEPSVLSSIEQILKTAGHNVKLATGGFEGIRKFQTEPADVVIIDIFMPDYDGIQLISHFRKSPSNVPIIAMSGNPKGNTLEMARKLGVVAAIQKPFAVDELLNADRKSVV